MNKERKHYILLAFLSFQLMFGNQVFSQEKKIEKGIDQWPVLKTYQVPYISKVAMPLGGIGTGVVYLTGRGELRDWSIMNRPGFGYDPSPSFFCIYMKSEGEEPIVRALEGPIEQGYDVENPGITTKSFGMPRFGKCQFKTAYPFGQVDLSDENLPVEVRVMAFNPLVPANMDESGIPIAVLRYVVTNTGEKPMDVSVCGNLVNFIGNDGFTGKPNHNKNEFRKTKDIQGIYFDTDSVSPCAEQYGTMALTTSSQNNISMRTSWSKSTLWFSTDVIEFWKDFSEDGILEDRSSDSDSPVASLSVQKTIAPGESEEFEFYLTWHFPNRNKWDWTTDTFPDDCDSSHLIGNYYTTKYEDAWDVAEKTVSSLPQLEQQTYQFVNTFIQSDFPEVVKEAALFNLSSLCTQTFFQDANGALLAFEGILAHKGGWPGNCTHVLNYEQTIPFLFGKLSQSLRNTEYKFATASNGKMAFRVTLPLGDGSSAIMAAADGQMGCLMKLYRDWQLSGDDQLLEELWPIAKKTLEFAWIEGGWDANQDGVMEGCQHNTMDVEYFGPNPQMGVWYLGALRASAKISEYMGDADFAEKCDKLYEQGSKWLDENLFNGEYYEQIITPPGTEVAQGLTMHSDIYGPEYDQFQLGDGCLVDQLVGQYMAHICGLGYLLDKEHITKTLHSILKYNSIDYNTHFSHSRANGFEGEKGLILGAYPKGVKAKPFPYFDEVMTGFEYSTAVHMMYEDMVPEGINCFANVRDRFDGKKRNPFNEVEAGSHYARAMAAWAAIPALSGFHYSGVDGAITFGSKPGFYFWSNGYAWGSCRIEGNRAELKVMYGELFLKKFILTGIGSKKLKDLTLTEDESLIVEI